MKKIVIAIDGHSSCGKSTMAKTLAKKLNYVYIDTGAMYRAVTLYALKNNFFAGEQINLDKLKEHLDGVKITFDTFRNTFLNGENVEKEIRSLEVSNRVSKISSIPFVRAYLVTLQRQMATQKGVVMDGRDIGTVVLPHADLKIFVTATAEIRAQRRYDELTQKGEIVSYEAILENVKMRDYDDEHRSESPLKKADDALLLDNSNLSIEAQNAWLEAQAKRIIEGDITIEIDQDSGFCFGVVRAIERAESYLQSQGELYCLGDIVHNSDEVERLSKLGLKVINHEQLAQLHDTNVLLRAHGEPPATYQKAQANNLCLIDATCSVVLALQKKIRNAYTENPDAQIVIYGQLGHAEVNGLVGQTDGKAVVVEGIADLDKLDFNKKIFLFSQTTKSISGFKEIVSEIEKRISDQSALVYYDTICRQVANRMDNIRAFASSHDVVLFVSGKKSSNGKFLFSECKKVNDKAYFISSKEEIDATWLQNVTSIGICGATSTPKWQMEAVKEELLKMIKNVQN